MRIYISGPMTGVPDLNRPAFYAAEQALRGVGHDPVNPHRETGEHDGWEWADYLRADIALLATCNALASLPGWQASRGAALERRLAHALRMPCLAAATWARRPA